MMKKLFFLCAFLFMSMQIQAQLYMVQTETCWGLSCEDVIIIHAPNSTEATVQPLGFNYDYDNSTQVQAWNDLNTVLNNIISDGYHVLPFSINETEGWNKLTFFLAIP
ncbi:MAG: hypothetical protein CMP56_01900 [Flavobacteriales bacterium]|nr:hypothetical protein [Flavobacteriales bacterium]|tara:strand:- start:350 stop:673 length:324 start_codon:yes stop_codon:yes gene_type:complete